MPVIGATEAEARALEAELERLIRARVRPPASSPQPLQVDRRATSQLDEQLPADLPAEDEIEGAKSRYTLIVDLARRERLTVRQLIGRLGGGRGHRTFAGTPEQVADAIEDWFDAAAPPTASTSCRRCCRPAWRRSSTTSCRSCSERGLFRTEYTGTHAARALRPRPPRQPVRHPHPTTRRRPHELSSTTAPSAAPASRSAR